MTNKYLIYPIIVLAVIVASVLYLTKKDGERIATESPSGEPQFSVSAVFPTPTAKPSASPRPASSATPQPSSSAGGSQSLVGPTVPWEQLTGEASCELTGEIRYLDQHTYDNQNARFIYKGIDHPARLIKWTVAPDDGLSIGPNLFAQMPLPDGVSLISVALPETAHYKTYELTASITYGRLVDGNVKVFTKACVGKTTVVLP